MSSDLPLVADTPTSPDMHLDWIMRELDAGLYKLPEEAIRLARQHRELVVPRLIQAIKNATEQARQGSLPKGNAHFFALFLLTEFNAKESLPTILEAVSLPDRLSDDLFGGAISDTLPRVFLVLSENSPDFLDVIVRNRQLNEFVRWSAVSGYVYLVRDGLLERSSAVDRLRHLLSEAVEDKDAELALALVNVLCDLGPKEAMDMIQEAYEADLVDPGMIGMEDVLDIHDRGEAAVREAMARRPPTAIDDTIEELREWACFEGDSADESDRGRVPPAAELPPRDFDLEVMVRELDDAFDFLPLQAIREARQHREVVAPRLIQVLKETTEQARSGVIVEGNAQLFALLLLAEFKVQEALPVIVDAMSLPFTTLNAVYFEEALEALSRVFVCLADDKPAFLDSVIRDRRIDELIRWKAAEGYYYLVRDGQLTREAAVEKLRVLLSEAIQHKDDKIAASLVCVLSDLWGHEARPTVVEAYHCGVVDQTVVTLKSFDAELAKGDECLRATFGRLLSTTIDDTLEELGHWGSSDPDDEWPDEGEEECDDEEEEYLGGQWEDEGEDLFDEDAQVETVTVVYDQPRVGRNDPCPCGSGKKFKKCCGARG